MVASWAEAVIFARALRRRAQLAVDPRDRRTGGGCPLVGPPGLSRCGPPLSNRLIDGITTGRRRIWLSIWLSTSRSTVPTSWRRHEEFRCLR